MSRVVVVPLDGAGGGPHAAVQALLPWYASGRLDDSDAAAVEAHLAGCARCRAELAVERRLHAACAAGQEAVPQASADAVEHGLARLLRRIGGDSAIGAAMSAEEAEADAVAALRSDADRTPALRLPEHAEGDTGAALRPDAHHSPTPHLPKHAHVDTGATRRLDAHRTPTLRLPEPAEADATADLHPGAAPAPSGAETSTASPTAGVPAAPSRPGVLPAGAGPAAAASPRGSSRPAAPVASARPSTVPAPRRRRRFLLPPWVRWLLAGQGVLAALLLGVVVVRPAMAPEDAAYRGLGAPAAAGTAAANAVAMFRADATEAQIRAALRAAGARLVDGPTATNAYLLQVPAAGHAAALARLRAQPAVTLAESLDAGAAP